MIGWRGILTFPKLKIKGIRQVACVAPARGRVISATYAAGRVEEIERTKGEATNAAQLPRLFCLGSFRVLQL